MPINSEHTLYLVRHGESTQNTGINRKERIPDHAIPLTERGHEQAQGAGQFLASVLANTYSRQIVLWNSPYFRTRETRDEILRFIHPGMQKEDDMLTELQFGIFDSMEKDEIKKQFPAEWNAFQNSRRFNGKFYARRPGGESPFDCEIRQKLFLDSLYRDINNGTCPPHIIIVGHGAQLNILRKALFHYSHEWYESEPNPGNCSIMKVVLSSAGNKDAGYIYGAAVPD